jgi:hypothetical protein
MAQNNGVRPEKRDHGMRTTKMFDIDIVRYNKSNLLMAFSQDIPGLLVSGRSETEIDEKLPGAIREILEAEGNTNISIQIRPEPDNLPAEFSARKFRANISLEHAT